MKAKAFTLVEILVVVIILGILAAIVIPRLSNATAIAKASMLADDLRVMRTQIEVFKAQHGGVAPGYPNLDSSQAPTEAAFIAHMTMSSKSSGETATPGTVGYDYGPYMSQMPQNPVNGKTSVNVLAGPATMPSAGGDSFGWIYQPTSITFKGDTSGTDDKGTDYFSY